MSQDKRFAKSPRSRRLLSLVACLFAGAGLVVVGLSAAVWTPGQGVVSSQADILDLFSAEDNPQADFQRALKHLGHEAPRAYDINGNTVYFSISNVDKKPIEVLKRYQDEFLHQKLNTRTYINLSQADSQQARQDMLTGGIIPSTISEQYVAMGGGITENSAQTPAELLKLQSAYQSGEVEKKFRGYRFIEAFQSPGARYTTVVASWSDDKFDYRKMLPGSPVPGQNADPLIPACPGCTRLHRFTDLDPARDHSDHIFISPASLQQTLSFYERALSARGWELEPTAKLLKEARQDDLSLSNAQILLYRRAGRALSLTIYPNDDNKIIAHLALSDG